MGPPPKITSQALLVYLIGRIESLHEKIDNAAEQHRLADRHAHLWRLIGISLRWSGTVTTQISTIFIASYLAFEHSWYVAKIVGWIIHIIHWRP